MSPELCKAGSKKTGSEQQLAHSKEREENVRREWPQGTASYKIGWCLPPAWAAVGTSPSVSWVSTGPIQHIGMCGLLWEHRTTQVKLSSTMFTSSREMGLSCYFKWNSDPQTIFFPWILVCGTGPPTQLACYCHLTPQIQIHYKEVINSHPTHTFHTYGSSHGSERFLNPNLLTHFPRWHCDYQVQGTGFTGGILIECYVVYQTLLINFFS